LYNTLLIAGSREMMAWQLAVRERDRDTVFASIGGAANHRNPARCPFGRKEWPNTALFTAVHRPVLLHVVPNFPGREVAV